MAHARVRPFNPNFKCRTAFYIPNGRLLRLSTVGRSLYGNYPRRVRCKLGSYYEKMLDGGKSLLHDGALEAELEVNAPTLQELVGVVSEMTPSDRAHSVTTRTFPFLVVGNVALEQFLRVYGGVYEPGEPVPYNDAVFSLS